MTLEEFNEKVGPTILRSLTPENELPVRRIWLDVLSGCVEDPRLVFYPVEIPPTVEDADDFLNVMAYDSVHEQWVLVLWFEVTRKKEFDKWCKTGLRIPT